MGQLNKKNKEFLTLTGIDHKAIKKRKENQLKLHEIINTVVKKRRILLIVIESFNFFSPFFELRFRSSETQAKQIVSVCVFMCAGSRFSLHFINIL